jgi:hypothetical protein
MVAVRTASASERVRESETCGMMLPVSEGSGLILTAEREGGKPGAAGGEARSA